MFGSGRQISGKWVSVLLSAENHLQLYIPKGFAHGFVVPSETADFLYKCSDYYDASDDRGVLWNDPEIGIDWQTPRPILSEKGRALSSTFADRARPVAAIPAMSVRLLITGATGQIGWHLQRTLAPLGDVTALTRDQLDLSDLDAVTRAVREFEPDVLVNAAAYTAVDKAESEPELARTINAVAPARMAEELARNGCLLVHYSTDYVFDGNKPTAECLSRGRCDRAAQCLRSDQAGRRAVDRRLLGARTSFCEPPGCTTLAGKNFLRTVLRLAREKEELRMVSDQYGAPTWARTIAEATAIILARSLERNSETGVWQSGLFHLTAAEQTSWVGFARAILEDYEALLDWPAETGEFGGPLKAKRVVPITSEQYQTPARRPRNSVLSNAKVQATFGIMLPDWRSQLRLAMQDAIR